MMLTNRARRAFSSGRMTWLFTYNMPESQGQGRQPARQEVYVLGEEAVR